MINKKEKDLIKEEEEEKEMTKGEDIGTAGGNGRRGTRKIIGSGRMGTKKENYLLSSVMVILRDFSRGKSFSCLFFSEKF
jgi:hypothetical protein